ncbi:MAG: hypothetical protein ACP5PJ_00655 [Acidimicrobiales bacterium]
MKGLPLKRLSELLPSRVLRRAARSTNPYLALPAAVFLVVRWLSKRSKLIDAKSTVVKVRPGESYLVSATTRSKSKGA